MKRALDTRILVIDDDYLNHIIVTRGLERLGYKIENAYDGAEGIRMALANPPDLIVCDIAMPEADGYTVIQRLQEHERLVQVPFIFLTARSDYDELRKGMALGADDYLTKPFSIKDLQAAVKTRLRRHHSIVQPIVDEMDALRSNIALLLPHELRTPLMLLEGYTSMLEEDLHRLDPDVRVLIEPVIGGTKRLKRLIENCLAYTDATLSPIQDTLIPLDAAAVIEQCAQRVTSDNQRSDDLVLHLLPDHVYFSESDLVKIVSELVDNACKFSEAGQPIHVVTTQEDRFYALEIADKGRGMTAAQINKIGAYMQFERQRYEQQGIGMGLVVAKQLAERNGTVFNIDSEVGAYTRVSVLLERASRSAAL